MADLGTGTGILPIVVNHVGKFQGKVYAFDKEANCIEAAKMNTQIFGLSDRFTPVEIDLVDLYYSKTTKFNENQLEFYKRVTDDLE